MPISREPVRFGLFEVDLTEGLVIKEGRRIKLREQPFRLLCILLEHPGETVTREQLRQALWAADTFVDFDRGLNAAMAKLRQALGDSAENPRFIETQARRGYRFIAPVKAPVETIAAPGTDHSKPRVRLRRLSWIALSALSLLIGGGLLYSERHRKQEGVVPRSLPPPGPLTTYSGFQLAPTFSPEGSRVAFAWDEPGKRPSNIYVKLIGTNEPVRLTTGDEGDFAPAWSPDGRYIAFLSARGSYSTAVVLIPSLGGPEREFSRLLLDATPFLNHGGWIPPSPLLAWASDSKWLLAVEQSDKSEEKFQIERMSVESGEKTLLKLFADPSANTALRNLPVSGSDAGPALSPEGKTLAFAHSVGTPNSDLFVVSLSADALPAGPPRSLHFDRSYCAGIAWYPDGQNLLVSSDRRGSMELWKVPLNPQREPFLLNVNDAGPREVAVSKSGQRFAFTHYSGDSDIWRVNLHSARIKDVAPLIASTRSEIRPSYSSDGQRIAFESRRSGNEEIWTSSADGSRTFQLTSSGNAYAGSPTWSPDDRQIAFDSNAAGKWNIYIIPAQGGKPVRFTEGSGSNIRPRWSRDGKWIYYCASADSGPQIWKKRAAGGPPIQVTKGGGCNQVETADGAYVYYLRPGERALWRVPAGGGGESEVVALTHETQFALGSHGAYFIETVVPANLKYLDFATGAINVLGVLPGPVYPDNGLTVSPDGHWLLYGKVGFARSQLMLLEGF